MLRYKVKVPFVDYGIFHPVNEIITDVSIISNRVEKLWKHTLSMIDDNGKEVPFENTAHVTHKANITPSRTVVSNTDTNKKETKAAVNKTNINDTNAVNSAKVVKANTSTGTTSTKK